MCQSAVWIRYPDGRAEKIGDDVLVVTQEGDMVVLRWLLAEPQRVPGKIQEVDSIKHIITLQVTEATKNPNEETEMPVSHPGPKVTHNHRHPH